MQTEAPLYRAEVPWLGPVLIRHAGADPWLGIGAHPGLGDPLLICLLPVKRIATGDDRWRWEVDLAVMPRLIGERLRPGRVGDWFNEPLPGWARNPPVQYVAVVLLYPQGGCIGRPIVDPLQFLSDDELHGLGARVAESVEPFKVDFRPDLRSTTPEIARLLEPLGDRGTDGGAGIDLGPADVRVAMPPARQPDPADARHYREQARRVRDVIAGLASQGDALPRGVVRLNRGRRTRALRLALGSCQYPPGIVNQQPGFESWRRLGSPPRAADGQPLDFVVLAGDQIYADATAGLFDPALLDDRFRKPYETWLRDEAVQQVVAAVPLLTTLDDHEIDDNWEPISKRCPRPVRERNAALRIGGINGFLRYQRPPRNGRQPPPTHPLWFKTVHNGVRLFILDTRSRRELRNAHAGGSMLGAAQWEKLKGWLLAEPDAPKVIVSAAALLPRHRRATANPIAGGGHAREALRSDGWDGFPTSFHALLAWVAEHDIRKLVFLSGDEHIGLYARASLPNNGGADVVIHSIHSPGLNSPYRFANTLRWELMLGTDAFEVPVGSGSRTCTVETLALDPQGFVSVVIRRQAGRWMLHVAFPGATLLPIELV